MGSSPSDQESSLFRSTQGEKNDYKTPKKRSLLNSLLAQFCRTILLIFRSLNRGKKPSNIIRKPIFFFADAIKPLLGNGSAEIRLSGSEQFRYIPFILLGYFDIHKSFGSWH